MAVYLWKAQIILELSQNIMNSDRISTFDSYVYILSNSWQEITISIKVTLDVFIIVEFIMEIFQLYVLS